MSSRKILPHCFIDVTETKIAFHKLDLFNFLGDDAKIIAFVDVFDDEVVVFDFLCSFMRPGVSPPPPGFAL